MFLKHVLRPFKPYKICHKTVSHIVLSIGICIELYIVHTKHCKYKVRYNMWNIYSTAHMRTIKKHVSNFYNFECQTVSDYMQGVQRTRRPYWESVVDIILFFLFIIYRTKKWHVLTFIYRKLFFILFR